MKKVLFKHTFKALIVSAMLLLTSLNGLFAQSLYSVIDISPSATNVSEQIPPAPARILLFGWQGTSGSTYTVRFKATTEPSLVVGIGAEITTTSFDQSLEELSVTLNYSGEKIIASDDIEIPENTFLIALDPGVNGTVLPANLDINPQAVDESQDCYGPGANPKLYQDDDNDFGDDDSLNDPIKDSDGIDTIGLPFEAAGSFASTNTFFWCIVPPQGETQAVGMRLLGAKNSDARLNLSLSQGMLDFMGSRLSRVLSASNLAIFSDLLQVGVNVKQTSDGAAIAVKFPIDSQTTKITIDSSSTIANAATINSRKKRQAIKTARAVSTNNFDQRTISIGVKEDLSIAPDSLEVKGKQVSFSGFVDDLSLVGEYVDLLRIGKNEKCGIEISAVKGTIIARSPIKDNGSYNVKIPSSAVFNDNRKKSTLVARLPGESIKTSREVSLSNKNRGLRQ